MVRLVALNNPRLAQAFIDYMASRHIEIKMLPEGNGQFALWLQTDEHQAEVEAELTIFLENPTASKYQAASWEVADSRTQKFQYSTPNFIDMIKAKAGPFTLLIMVTCIVIYTLQILGLARQIFEVLHFPSDPQEKWQLWRWVSHALLHFSITHIAFNLLWWWELGGDIEKKLGSLKLLQIFIFSAVLSGAAQYWVGGANFGGLSGVVYALLGYIWIRGILRPNQGLFIPKSIVIFMLAWLVIGYIQPFMAIANSAHLAGLIAGCAMAALEGRSKAEA